MKLIYCENKRESDDVLQKLENQGVTWYNGTKPTKNDYFEEGIIYKIHPQRVCDPNVFLTCYQSSHCDYKELIKGSLTAEKFLRDDEIRVLQYNSKELKKILI